MASDGGGWTLVAASRGRPLKDERAGWYDDLLSTSPEDGHAGIWDGLRNVVGTSSDLRFACRSDSGAAELDVDMIFYSTDWYREVTMGADADSCFLEGNCAGYDMPHPARRDLLAGAYLPRGDAFEAFCLEAEDTCGDEGDFIVDFDDRGMDSSVEDSTNWGEDDDGAYCGTRDELDDGAGTWLIWAREARPSCLDGVKSGEETDIDCGGECGPCATGLGCSSRADCEQGECLSELCQAPSCSDMLWNGDELAMDCGGSCPACPIGSPCSDPIECEAPAECLGGLCRVATGASCSGGHEECPLGQVCYPAGCQYPMSCEELWRLRRTHPSGSFTVSNDMGTADVYCDLSTDDGGWTLVAASAGLPPSDSATSSTRNLGNLFPEALSTGVWNGMRSVTYWPHDVRFSCKTNRLDAAMAVDLSFYRVGWYLGMTTGTDADHCFSTYDDPMTDFPRRRDNVSGMERSAGDPWDAGVFIGEDSCGDNGDFTVDFDDRGMDNNQLVGTDWGLDDYIPKCGSSYPGEGAYFLWVRTQPVS